MTTKLAAIAHAESAAAVRSVRDLPDALRDHAEALLVEYAQALEEQGHEPDDVACLVAGLLFRLAFFQPDECPTVDDVLDARWPWTSNYDRRHDLTPEPDGRFSHALLLRQGRSTEKEAAPISGRGRNKKVRTS